MKGGEAMPLLSQSEEMYLDASILAGVDEDVNTDSNSTADGDVPSELGGGGNSTETAEKDAEENK